MSGMGSRSTPQTRPKPKSAPAFPSRRRSPGHAYAISPSPPVCPSSAWMRTGTRISVSSTCGSPLPSRARIRHPGRTAPTIISYYDMIAATTPPPRSATPLAPGTYRALAAFRYEIRRFLRRSEDAARSAGLEPQQHQLLLALKGAPHGTVPTIAWLAERLQLQHHSLVGLVDRLAGRQAGHPPGG